MDKSQPTYTKEFKRQAVNLFETSGKSRPISVFLTLSRLDNVKPAKKQAHVTLKCL